PGRDLVHQQVGHQRLQRAPDAHHQVMILVVLTHQATVGDSCQINLDLRRAGLGPRRAGRGPSGRNLRRVVVVALVAVHGRLRWRGRPRRAPRRTPAAGPSWARPRPRSTKKPWRRRRAPRGMVGPERAALLLAAPRPPRADRDAGMGGNSRPAGVWPG